MIESELKIFCKMKKNNQMKNEHQTTLDKMLCLV